MEERIEQSIKEMEDRLWEMRRPLDEEGEQYGKA